MTEATAARDNAVSQRVTQAREELAAAAEKLQKAATGLAGRVEKRSSDLFQSLVKTGEQVEKQRSKGKKAGQKAKAEPGKLETYAGKVFNALGLPTANDLQALNRKIDSLSRKVRKLEKAGA